MIAMAAAFSPSAGSSRKQSLKLLNQHLAAAVILQDRMQQSQRHVRGPDFIMVDDLCDRVARLMQGCTTVIASRVEDLGGVPQWPAQLGLHPAILADEADVAISSPLDAFAQSVLDAATVAEAYGDATTADLLAGLWRDVDRHLWRSVKSTYLRGWSA